MIRYRPLFHVDVAHDYFLSRGDVVFEAHADADRAALANLYAVSDFLEIGPDDATVSTLAGHKMIFKTTGSGFIVAVQLDPSAPDRRPLVPPPPHFRLTFALRLADQRFANYTELGPIAAGFYRFGNDSQNHTAGVNFLSSRVPAFSATRRYVAGEVRAQATGATFDLFLALRDTGPAVAPVPADWRRIPSDTFSASTTYRTGAIVLFSNRLFRALVDNPGTDLTNANDWQPVGELGNQYATITDAILPVSGLFNLDISDTALAMATVRAFPSGATVAATEQTFTTAQGTLSQVQVDLRGLMPGRYRVRSSTPPVSLFVSSRATSRRRPSPKSGSVSSRSAEGPPTSPCSTTTAHCELRATWCAFSTAPRVGATSFLWRRQVGIGAELAVEAGNNRILVTPAPRPLTRFGVGSRLQADSAATPTVVRRNSLAGP